jgi:hypothetical protein
MFSSLVFFGLTGFSALLLVLAALIISVFEIVMFINAILNKFINGGRKALWIIGMLLIHPFVAIAYYFTDYKKRS